MMSRRRVLSNQLRRQIGLRLRELRVQHSESQEVVAWAADVSQGTISNYESGRNEIPLSVLMSICEYFNTSLAEFFSDSGAEEAELPADILVPAYDATQGSRPRLTEGHLLEVRTSSRHVPYEAREPRLA